MAQIITLRELKIGDKFYPASKIGKSTPFFKVVGPNEYSSGHGSAVRRCIDLSKNKFVNKSSRLKVVVTKN
jgi:hypothetical protein